MSKRTLLVLSLFAILTWSGSAAIAVGVTQLAEGPRGEQGEVGPAGSQGERGPRGFAGQAASQPLEGFNFDVFRLAQMFAVEQVGEASGHPQTEACIDYIMDGEGSFVECGFTRIEP